MQECLGFCPLSKLDAASVTQAILSQLEKWGLEIKHLRGQGYGRASTMSGHVNGVQQRIRELQPHALFTHCRSHALNLVVVHRCSVMPLIRSTMPTIENVAVFFSASAVRKDMLKEQPQGSQEKKSSDQKKIGGIPLMSVTRWGSRGKTVGTF